jgi:hypothetical protein
VPAEFHEQDEVARLEIGADEAVGAWIGHGGAAWALKVSIMIVAHPSRVKRWVVSAHPEYHVVLSEDRRA